MASDAAVGSVRRGRGYRRTLGTQANRRFDGQERSTEAGGVREQIVDTALAYHLVSQYTSLVAVDVTPSRPLAETLASHAVPTHLPKGWEFDKVFGSLPRTATAAPLFLAMGAGLLFLGAVFAFETRQVR